MKYSMRRVIAANRRALSIWGKKSPGLLPFLVLSQVSGAALPYVGIYFSARILTELSGEKNAGTLFWLVASLLAIETLCGLFYHFCKNRYEALEQCEYCGLWNILAEKMLSFDFAKVDDTRIQNQRTQILGMQNWAGRGLYMVILQLKSVLKAACGVAGAAALTVGFFLTKTEDASFGWLDSPWTAVVFVAGMFGSAALGAWLVKRGEWHATNYADAATFGNRMWSFTTFDICRPWRALDVRMYEQMQPVFALNEKTKVWGTGTETDRQWRGIAAVLSLLADVSGRVFVGVIYLMVCLKAYAGAFGIGAVTQYIGAATAMFHNLSELLQSLGRLVVNTEFLERTFAFLDIENEMYQGSLTVEKRNDCNYEVEFRDVSFRYPGTERDVLNHVSMKFKIGEKLAIVGENGSGKSTFIKLLCRLYDPTEGEILLNGINIRKYNYREYMSIFSVVFQDFKLFALPLGQNVAASVDYDAARVRECLEKAGFSERASRMEKGLDTYLYKDFDEDGVNISGGEEQKIALARALYQDAAFLILDEPTAALDPVAEAEVYAGFNDMVGDRTAVYISHRLSSCRFCDKIAVFDGGRIVQQGSHDELVADAGGKYYALWSAQAQYYA